MRFRVAPAIGLLTAATVVLGSTSSAAVAAPGRTGDAQRFGTWTGYEVGAQPIAVVSADLDGDGAPDVAYARQSSGHNTMVVQLNAGDGSMRRATGYRATPRSNDIAAGDLDGDGDQDIVVVSEGVSITNTVIDLYLNDGTGRFAHITASGGHGAQRVVLADLDDDADLDLAVTSAFSQQTVSVLLGRGDGTFRREQLVVVGTDTTGIDAADLDGDGLLDLAVGWNDTNIASYVALLVNRGSGSFTVAKNVALPVNVGSPVVAAGDFNADGRADIAAAGTGSGAHFVLRNRGGLSFTSTTYAAGFTSTNLLAADVDGDGMTDLLSATVGTSNTGTVSYLRNQGRGVLAPPVSVDAGAQPWDVAVGDFDGDGRLDLAVANNGSGTGGIHPQRPDGSFADRPVYPAVPGELPLDTASADFDGDGLPDMAVSQIDITSGGADVVAILHNDGSGAMRLNQTLPTGTDSHAKSLYASDLNGDGYPDLLWTPEQFTTGPYSLVVALNDGDGSFGALQTYTLTSNGTGHVTTADLDGDGDQDAIVANNRGPSGVRVLLNRGDGTFRPDYAVAMGDFQEMAIGVDLDGDGVVDIAAVEPQVDGSSQALMVVRGRGGATFGRPTTYTVGNGPREIAAGDLDGDGDLDLVTANQGGDAISNFSLESTTVLLNGRDGTFGSISTLPTEQAYRYFDQFAVALGDIDGDGALDIVAAHPHGQTVGVYYGVGDGRFRPEVRYGVHANATDVNLADYNGDRRLDIGVPTTENDGAVFPTGGVSVLLNRRLPPA